MTEAEPNEIADLLAPFWSASRTAEALGVTADELEERSAARAVLGTTTTDGSTVYPIWQFHRLKDGTVEVKPDFVAFFTALQGITDPWTIAIVLRTPAPELGGSTPEDWIHAKGDLATLMNYAHLIASEFRR